jgi:hypothetical protein
VYNYFIEIMEGEPKYDWSNKTDPVAKRMKEYEASSEVCGNSKLNPEKIWLVRLGCSWFVPSTHPTHPATNTASPHPPPPITLD